MSCIVFEMCVWYVVLDMYVEIATTTCMIQIVYRTRKVCKKLSPWRMTRGYLVYVVCIYVHFCVQYECAYMYSVDLFIVASNKCMKDCIHMYVGRQVYGCACVCARMYAYLHTHTCMDACKYLCMHTRKCTYICTCAYKCIYTYTFTCAQVHACRYAYMYM